MSFNHCIGVAVLYEPVEQPGLVYRPVLQHVGLEDLPGSFHRGLHVDLDEDFIARTRPAQDVVLDDVEGLMKSLQLKKIVARLTICALGERRVTKVYEPNCRVLLRHIRFGC